ncbi:MAG: DUF4368 domain-containing protein [Candidatus Howiella sp.]
MINRIKKYGTIDKLTRPLLVELINEIRVHEGGSITIGFKFQDAYKNALEYIEVNREIAKTA